MVHLTSGTEYVVDMVSMDGVHKCVALWEYDRRAINGAGFVCMGQRLMCDDEERVAALVEYEKKVLDALGIFNGPSHGEVKWHQGELAYFYKCVYIVLSYVNLYLCICVFVYILLLWQVSQSWLK